MKNEFVSHQPEPLWVNHIDFTEIELHPQDLNVQLLLIDRQCNATEKSTYFHYAIKILDPVGLKNCSHFNLTFDPEYQKLLLHSFCIHRKGQKIDKLDMDKVKILQREQELEFNIYNGHNQALVFLDDVRIGDIIEYSYSIAGGHPLFRGVLTTQVPLQYNCSIGKLYHRIIHPFEHLEMQHCPSECESYLKKDDGELSWLLQPSPPLDKEEIQQGPFYNYASVDISSFVSWQDVIEWAEKLYSLDPAFETDIEVAELLNEWKSLPKEEGVLKALRFVQDEIRYLGLEEGVCSHLPTPSLQVFQRRFGDCKDKTQLLRHFLHAMDIPSYPCLVQSNRRIELDKKLPSPDAFDHVIVCIDLNGECYYVDPTSVCLGGGLRSSICYKHGLVIASDFQDLVSIPLTLPKKGIEAKTLVTLNSDDSGKLEVKTIYYDHEADYWRYELCHRKVTELEKAFLADYKKSFAKIKIDQPLHIEDKRNENQIIMNESYLIEDFWEAGGGFKEHIFPAYLLFSHLSYENELDPKITHFLSHPKKIHEEIALKGFGGNTWEDWKVEHPAFSCESFHQKGDPFKIFFNFETHVDSLLPEELPEYSKKLVEAIDCCGILLSKSTPQKEFSNLNWQPFAMMGMFCFSIFMFVVLYKTLRK